MRSIILSDKGIATFESYSCMINMALDVTTLNKEVLSAEYRVLRTEGKAKSDEW